MVPTILHVVGRPQGRENGDLCGEYIYVGIHGDRAGYRKRGAATVIRYAAQMGRWVIDRQGFTASEVVVAYADNSVDAEHPGHWELIWHVWEARAQAHVADAEVAAVDAPATVSLVGRSPGRENSSTCGEYELSAVHYGRPVYSQRQGDAVLRYHAPEGRWLISASVKGNICSGFAEGVAAPHPGFAELQWYFWESQKNAFLADPGCKTLGSPSLVHVVGRAAHMENGMICGTYHLAGVHEGRPVYVQPGTQKVMRYSAKTDRWLIDCDGLTEPSLMSRLYQWILSGDPATERCSAFADACDTPHPGCSSLEWQVWEARGSRHSFDPMVRGTTAPLALRVSGRSASRENGDIVGDYLLAGTHCGRPAYVKSGTRLAIRYWPPMSRWVMDREGLRNSDHCVAFVDDLGETEHPALTSPWHVFESSRGCHLADPSVIIKVPADAPKSLQVAPLPGAPKRGFECPQDHDAKRARWLAKLGG